MRLKLFPRQQGFFDLFVRAAQNTVEGARAYRDMCVDFSDPKSSAKAIRVSEHAGDSITHETVRALNTTFVTPIDREDIHALTTTLDDVMDYIEAAADMYNLHGIEEPTPFARDQAEILVRICEATDRAIVQLRKFKGIDEMLEEIHTIENEGDQVYRKAIADLFNGDHKAMSVLKWKEIYDQVEKAIDRCEVVANLIEAIVLKHA